jgi:hypothetical protein
MKSYVNAAFAVSFLGATALALPTKHQLIKPIQYSRIIEITLHVGQKKSITLTLQEKPDLSAYFVNHWEFNTELSSYESVVNVGLVYSKAMFPKEDYATIDALNPGTALLVFEHTFGKQKEVVGSLIYKVTVLP